MFMNHRCYAARQLLRHRRIRARDRGAEVLEEVLLAPRCCPACAALEPLGGDRRRVEAVDEGGEPVAAHAGEGCEDSWDEDAVGEEAADQVLLVLVGLAEGDDGIGAGGAAAST